uniref:NADH-ubiquinone oxidoreductase chain 4 n=1 Tax=Chinolyda flagellicornis TaxID=2492400 RepID=A0A3G8FWD3_9HYME|nr:NADH dehydrogenase subunit 4 [Chinolyda flagellicornis]
MMMKFLLMMLFMMPLFFFNNMFWLIQNLFMMMVFMFFLFNWSFMYEYKKLSYFMGLDMISFWLIMLTMLIISLMFMASEGLFKSKYYLMMFSFIVMLLLLLLYLTFSSINLFLFYIYFESSLIPTLILILGWGYQPERINAGMYLLFYTLFMSFPLLLSILYIYNYCNSFMFIYLMNIYNKNSLFYLFMLFAFLVKMPMFLAHLWLPKAHVEAPISGSMILAGIMLKLGGYGMMRIMNMISINFNFIWMSVSLIGGFVVSMMCLRQVDMKSLIAYSSVVHMGMILGGMMTLLSWGFNGAYILMIGHGLSSSGLFCLANLIYDRLSSRSLLINKGLMNLMPSMSLWWFLMCSSSMASPPSLNLMGEIILLSSIISWSWMSTFMLMLMSFFSTSYTLYLYSYSQHGNFYSGIYSYSQGYIREYLLLIMHWFPLNFLILKSEIIMF